MVRTRTGKEIVPQQSDSEGEEMNSIRSSKQQGQEAESDIDPATYKLFQRVMAKMISEQAEENPVKMTSKGKTEGKVSKQQVQYGSTSESAEEDLEEEQPAYFHNPLYRPKKISEGHESASKAKIQTPAGDPMHEQLREVARAIKDLQAQDKGKKIYTGADFYDGLEGDDDWEDLPCKFIKFDGTGNPKAHLATFFAECNRFRKNNRVLFLCFSRSLEGVAARWYADHINPIEL